MYILPNPLWLKAQSNAECESIQQLKLSVKLIQLGDTEDNPLKPAISQPLYMYEDELNTSEPET